MPKKILVVEDEAEARSAFSDILSQYQLYLIKSGKQGIEIAKNERPDLIISDLRMPEISGPEMVNEIRKEKIFSSVVFISGFGDSVNRDEAAQLGAFDFLEKPIKKNKVLQVVKTALMFGYKSISTLSLKQSVNLKEEKEFIDLEIKNFPNSLLRKLQEYCSIREQNMEETITKWISEKIEGGS